MRPLRSAAVLIATAALVALDVPAGLGAEPPAGAPSHARSEPPARDGRYVVVLRDEVADPAAVADEHSRRHGARVEHVYTAALKGYAATVDSGRLGEVRSDPRVAFVEADREVRALGSVPIAAGDTAPTGVRRIGAATTTTAQPASGAAVAVIDTGIDLLHPDLDATSGANCVTPGLPAQDDHGHGTHVAGTVAARNDGAGVVGVAPGTKVHAVKVLSAAGVGLTSQVICGIDWVTANAASRGIKVANMSLGGDGSGGATCAQDPTNAQHRAICGSTAAGVAYVVAAGNDGANLAGSEPARYAEVLTVTAMSDSDGAPGGTGGAPTCRTGEKDDQYATFSNYAVGATEAAHTVAGPGVCIRSTHLGGGYATFSGTSMASPHLAGTVALCIDAGGVPGPCGGLTPAQAIQRVRADAQAHATAANGFVGDPIRPVTFKRGRHRNVTPYFGYLAWAGGY